MSVLSHLKLPEHQYTPQVPVIDSGLISSTAQSISRQHEAAKDQVNAMENKVLELGVNGNALERDLLNTGFAEASAEIQEAVEQGRYREIADKLPSIYRDFMKRSLPVLDSIKNRQSAIQMLVSHNSMPQDIKGILLDEVQNGNTLMDKPLIAPSKFLGDSELMNWAQQIRPEVTQQIVGSDNTSRTVTLTELSRETIIDKLTPALASQGSPFFEQEKFIADIEMRRSGGEMEYMDEDGILQKTSDPSLVAASRVRQNIMRISGIRDFSQSTSTRATTTRSRQQIHDQLLSRGMNRVPVPLGSTEERISYDQWYASEVAPTTMLWANTKKELDSVLQARGFERSRNDNYLIVDSKTKQPVSASEEPDIYSLLSSETQYASRMTTLKYEDDLVNKRSLSAARAEASKIGIDPSTVLMSHGVLFVNGKNQGTVKTSDKEYLVIDAFNNRKNQEADSIVDSRPLQFTGYELTKYDGDGKIDTENANFIETLNKSATLNTMTIQTRFASGRGGEKVSFNEKGDIVIGKGDPLSDYKNARFEIVGFTVSSEDGRPMAFGRMVHGEDASVIPGLGSVTVKGDYVSDFVKNKMGTDYMALKQAENVVSFIDSKIPRTGAESFPSIITQSELDMIGLNIVPDNTNGYTKGTLENISIKNIGGQQVYEVRYEGIDEPVTYTASNTIDFITNQLPKIQESMRIQSEYLNNARVDTEVSFTDSSLENVDSTLSSYLKRTIQVESSGDNNARATTSTATGPFQFVRRTWLSYMQRFPEYTEGKSTQQILNLRTNRDIATKVAVEFTKDNAEMLRQRNIPVRPDTLYAMHFLGPTALNVLNKPDTTPIRNVVPENFVSDNPSVFRNIRTVADFKNWLKEKYPES